MLIKARAKINLLLNVTGTRPDGYHELETIMQTLELHDRVELTRAPDITLSVEGADLPVGPENLAFRAADLLRRETGYGGGAAIKLTKYIPIAAGLAGGSADAAAVLSGLNKLWGLGLKKEELVVLGARIGSDVPFCLHGGTALVKGRGEIVRPLPDMPPLDVVLVKPPFAVSTREVYQRFDSMLEAHHPDCSKMLAAVMRRDPGALVGGLGNSLEAVTVSMFPVIKKIKQELLALGALGVLMSGSGPTVFAIYKSRESALKVIDQIGQLGYWTAVSYFDGRSRNNWESC